MPPWRSASNAPPTPSRPRNNSLEALPPPRPVPSVPAPGLHLPAPPPPQPQPRTVKLTSSALLSLPYRLAHPPPAKSQVSSWGIVPTFDIKLQDILDRKHLPPLGLKDFEEWLLFVEHSPQDLYFILWLREYTTRYNFWSQQSRQHQQILLSNSRTPSPLATTNPHLLDRQSPVLKHTPNSSLFPSHPNNPFILPHSQPSFVRPSLTSPIPPSPPPSPTLSLHPPSPPRKTYYHPRYLLGPPLPPPPSLTLFYARAKETFLTPNGPYELQVPSDVLSIFHLSNDAKSSSPEYGKPLAPPPDPAIFNELAHIIQQNLKESLDRFVVATFNNVGTPRAHCGSVGGLTIGLAWSVPPLIASFTLGGARWWRLIALPGMWLGLTIFISAMYGVCMMIYIFGDLRQLRSFELSRPSISPPKPLLASHSANPRSPALNAFAAPNAPNSIGSGNCNGKGLNRERKGSVTREMISSPVRIPKPITRPPKAIVVGKRLSTVTIGSTGQGGSWNQASEGWQLGLPTRPMNALVASEYSSSSLASLATDSASSALYSDVDDVDEDEDEDDDDDEDHEDEDEESDDEGYAESIASSSEGYYSSSKRKQELGRKKKAKRSRPRIFISDALYDEHPSPEGPATASFSPDGTGVVWGDGARRRGVRDPIRRAGGGGAAVAVTAAAVPGVSPLWPDYEANDEEEMNATATFIGGYVYEDVDFRFGEAECEWSVRSRSFSMSRGGEGEDLEAQMGRRAVERQPVGSFDFDALPPPRNRSGSLVGDERVKMVGTEDEEKQAGRDGFGQRQERYLEHQQQKQRRQMEMRRGRGGWRWRMLVYIQTKCGPGNAVSMQLRKVAMAAAGGGGGESGSGRTSPTGSEKSRFGVGQQHPTLEKNSPPVKMKFQYEPTSQERENPKSDGDVEKQDSKGSNHMGYFDLDTKAGGEMSWKEGFKKVSKVPAFAAPLTPVLNPVVGRAQWEIVVRSAVVSAVVSLVVVGGLVAVPVPG